jgi:hypothetical protein
LQQPSYGFYFISWRFKLHVSITFLDYLQVWKYPFLDNCWFVSGILLINISIFMWLSFFLYNLFRSILSFCPVFVFWGHCWGIRSSSFNQGVIWYDTFWRQVLLNRTVAL